jgi:uncharacterized membrane protein (DUF4010 family)
LRRRRGGWLLRSAHHSDRFPIAKLRGTSLLFCLVVIGVLLSNPIARVLSMDPGSDFDTVRDFATALLIGALIGIEREKRKTESGGAPGGLRTFILIALVGASAGWLSKAMSTPWLLVGSLAAVTMLVLAGYIIETRTKPNDLGLTTEIAAIATFLLGAMATIGHTALAVGLAIAAAAVLAYKQPLHGAVAKLGWDDVFAGLRLLIASFIVLPLLPNRAIDPWGALNPYSVWLQVLLISGLSLVGYAATRWLGSDKGLALTGITGGLVSSTAVTLSFVQQSRAGAGAAAHFALAGGILLAWCIMFARVITEVLVINRALVTSVLVPFGAMGVVAGLLAWIYFRRDATSRGEPASVSHDVAVKNPFSLTAAAKVAAFLTAVLVVVKIVQQNLPATGVYVVAALAGLADVDAIALSMAESARSGDARTSVNAIVIATVTNTVVKCGMVMTLGAPALKPPILVATAAILVTGIGVIMLW